MEYEFTAIESLIRSAIEQSDKSNKTFEERFAQVRNAVALERDRIKKSFAFRVWQIETDQQKSHYVQYHQHRLVALIDELFEISNREDQQQTREHSRLSREAFFLFDQLDDILNTIRKDVSEYFSLDVKVPESDKAKLLKSIQCKSSEIQNYLSQRNSAHIAVCFRDIGESAVGEKLTYRKIQYLEMITDSIEVLLKKNSDNHLNETDLRSLLLSLNYNRSEYFKYFVDLVQAELSELGSDSERLEKLAFHYKTINQIQLIPGLAFHPGSKGIVTRLSEWIYEEVEFLERKRFLTTNAQIAENDFAKKDFKLEFDMSVSQFAFFIKAFIETGVIQNKNISELIRFLSKFVKTKRSENISYESFRIKYYNVEGTTKDAVKNTFHTAIGFINSD